MVISKHKVKKHNMEHERPQHQLEHSIKWHKIKRLDIMPNDCFGGSMKLLSCSN